MEEQTKLDRLKEVVHKYQNEIKEIPCVCKNCELFDNAHVCCEYDVNCYKRRDCENETCDKFKYNSKLQSFIDGRKCLTQIEDILYE